MSYALCGHCNQYLSEKTVKEHQRLYYEDGTWIKLEAGSRDSSPMCFSLPDDKETCTDTNSNPQLSECDEDFFDNLASDEDHSDAAIVNPESDVVEYWIENDSDIDEDFYEPLSLEEEDDDDDEDHLTGDEKAIIWWLVTFTCIFETLHSLSVRAVAWLLSLLGCLLTFFGQYSEKIKNIARAFPSTLHLRKKYLKDQRNSINPSVYSYVVCSKCHSIYKYQQCIEKISRKKYEIKTCIECKFQNPLLKKVITSNKNSKYYPFLVYPYVSLVSSLKGFLSRPNFYHQCQHWHLSCPSLSTLSDVYNGIIWKTFFDTSNLDKSSTICFMLNIDWFQPFKHRIYSIGVLYLAIMNLPRSIRFKRENIIIVGLIPGPSEPSKTVNSYLTPLVSELLTLWNGVEFEIHGIGIRKIYCALLCIGCDLPAARKVCGFLSYTANLGCSRCYCNFGTGIFGKQDYSGFERSTWEGRENERHRKDVESILKCKTKTARKKKESELGCRYSCLLQLPYFDAVKMLIIDPMHNLYLGTAKHVYNLWIEQEIISASSVSTINHRIRKLNVPPEVRFSQLPACMDHPSSLTAEQWILWVNYYSLYCLYDLISTNYFECWRHFVLASRLLCKRELSGDEIKLADALLMQFCRKFEQLFGKDAVTPNMHLHAHLVDCVWDYGPMSSFWLFAFERFNGILGDEPTNNRSIELQLMRRFLRDNEHLQLLMLVPRASSELTSIFSRAIVDHVCSYTSVKHLDSISECTTNDIVPATKYTICAFSDDEMEILTKLYCKLFPTHFAASDRANLPQCHTFRKMNTISIHGQKLKVGQYILATSVFDFPCPPSAPSTVLNNVKARPAKIEYFAVHSVHVSSEQCLSNILAVVSWPMLHTSQSCIGRPHEVWCYSAYETYNMNYFIPITNFVTYLLTAQLNIGNEEVLVTVPVI